MKIYLAIAALLAATVSMAQTPQQIVINVDRTDFNPMQKVNWRLMVGSSSLGRTEDNISRAGNGLGLTIEKMMNERMTIGGQYSNVRSLTSDSENQVIDADGNATNYEYRETVNMLNAYGKYSFVNYPINKWNLIQANLLGGLMVFDKGSRNTDVIYGASASYNYDNIIGFELSTKLNFKAENSTSASLIGYF